MFSQTIPCFLKSFHVFSNHFVFSKIIPCFLKSFRIFLGNSLFVKPVFTAALSPPLNPEDHQSKSFCNSPVVEGGVSPPSEGVNETNCSIPIWGPGFRISMLFSHMRGCLRDMGVFTPKNGPTLSTRGNMQTAI